MFPSCFEVTHPILIRLTPKGIQTEGIVSGNRRPVWLSLRWGLQFLAEGGVTALSPLSNTAQQKGPVLIPSCSLLAEATFLTIRFYNPETSQCPCLPSPQNNTPQVTGVNWENTELQFQNTH